MRVILTGGGQGLRIGKPTNRTNEGTPSALLIVLFQRRHIMAYQSPLGEDGPVANPKLDAVVQANKIDFDPYQPGRFPKVPTRETGTMSVRVPTSILAEIDRFIAEAGLFKDKQAFLADCLSYNLQRHRCLRKDDIFMRSLLDPVVMALNAQRNKAEKQAIHDAIETCAENLKGVIPDTPYYKEEIERLQGLRQHCIERGFTTHRVNGVLRGEYDNREQ